MSDAIKAEIKNLEDRRFQAMIDDDFDTLDKLLGDDLIYTHSSGQSDTRAQYIELCKKGVFKYPLGTAWRLLTGSTLPPYPPGMYINATSGTIVQNSP